MPDLTPYLAVRDARAATQWYVDVLGARRRAEPIVMDDGRIGHQELSLGDAVLMLADEFPEIGVTAPDPGGGASVTLLLTVDDVDAVVDRARAAGGRIDRGPQDTEHGRVATVRDPYGHRWLISSRD